MVSTTDSANGKADKTKSAFKMEYSVSIDINASSDKIWSLLTKADDYTRWNSTITSLEGSIDKGCTIKLKSTLDAKRTFKLAVKECETNSRMVWASGAAPMFKGVRTFRLDPLDDGSIRFSMNEVFSGLMLPMIGGALPDFTEAFEHFAADLKKEAEKES